MREEFPREAAGSPDGRDVALVRATARMATELVEAPAVPSLMGAVGLFGEILAEEAGHPVTLAPYYPALKGLRYATMKAVEDRHVRYVLTDDDTPDVRYRHLDLSIIGQEFPYGDMRTAVAHANLDGWQELTYARDWRRMAACLALNDELIKIDTASGMSAMPVRARGIAVGADSGGEVSCGAFGVALASAYSSEMVPELEDDPDQMRLIARDLTPWFVRRGHRPFQRIFTGRHALSFMNYGALRLEHRGKRIWSFTYGDEFDNPQLGDPHLKAPHLGCVVGIRGTGQGGPSDLKRTVWAGINASYDAGLYDWQRAQTAWQQHPRRELALDKLKEYLDKQEAEKPPAIGETPSELLTYHIKCNAVA